MSTSIGLNEALRQYLLEVGIREHPALARIRERTLRTRGAGMLSAPEEAALLGLLVRLTHARQILEVGTYTGYSSTAMALALPAEGRIVCCDISREFTDLARRGWTDAGVADRVVLHVGPALESLDRLLAEEAGGSFDMAFIDADKQGYDAYYERALRLVRPGGLVAIDNTLWDGLVADLSVTDADTVALRTLNAKIHDDGRVEAVITPVGDGLTLARVR
jgi:predicted O-methyltransferase YrrM